MNIENKTVKIRSYESMVDEFGAKPGGFIPIEPDWIIFSPYMKHLCGTTIKLEDDRHQGWTIHEAMVEEVIETGADKWEAKFGKGQKIRCDQWPEGKYCVFTRFVGLTYFMSTGYKPFRSDYWTWDDDCWELYKAPLPPEKLSKDFPRVEVRDHSGQVWAEAGYIYTRPNGSFSCINGHGRGEIFGQMRAIEPIEPK